MTPSSPFIILDYAELDSTNEEARRLLQAESLHGLTLIRTLSQTAGRGTQGRPWISPPGAGLYFSIVHPFSALEATHQTEIPLTPIFTLAAGVACAETIRDMTGLTIQLKPVNDLYVDNRKLGGILVESLITGNHCRALITGIGINVFEHEAVVTGCETENRGNRPVSLQACMPPQLFNQWHGEAIMDELSRAITTQVHCLYQSLIAGEFELILARYEAFKLAGYDLPIVLKR